MDEPYCIWGRSKVCIFLLHPPPPYPQWSSSSGSGPSFPFHILALTSWTNTWTTPIVLLSIDEQAPTSFPHHLQTAERLFETAP